MQCLKKNFDKFSTKHKKLKPYLCITLQMTSNLIKGNISFFKISKWYAKQFSYL